MSKTKKVQKQEKPIDNDVLNAIRDSNIEIIKDNIENIAKENSELTIREKVNLKQKSKLNDIYSYLKGNLESEILSTKTSEIADLSKDVKKYMKRQLDYVAFVFYIWNPKNLNIKIIPLYRINPILDLVNLKEFYFLYRPAMFIDGKPIFLIIRNIPLSFELNLLSKKEKDKNGNQIDIVKNIELNGYDSSEVRALLKSGFTKYLFGKPSFSYTQVLYLVFMIITICLIEYIVISTIYGFL